jgi:hypothetical protein
VIDAHTELLIIKLLGEGRRPEDLISLVCERTGMTWDAAKEEINRVQSRNQGLILSRKRRLAVAVGIPTVVGGLLFMAIGIFGIVVRERVLIGTNLPAPRAFIMLGMGIAMTVGGLVGIFTVK